MKKFLAILLAMLFAMVSVAALAEDTEPNIGQTIGNPVIGTAPINFVITKTYNIVGNASAVNPADLLKFEVKNASFKNDGTAAPNPIPAPTIADVTVKLGDEEADITVSLPPYTVPGVYSYEITETDTNVAGITYLSDTLYLVVTVINGDAPGSYKIGGIAVHKGSPDGTKIDDFENTYSAGTLAISKTVEGNQGDTAKVWNFTVTLTAPEGDTVKAPITVKSDSNATSFKEGDADVPADGIAAGWTGTKTFALQLKHGEKITLENIPAGVKYSVTETEANQDGYVTTPAGAQEGAIAANVDTAIDYTNTKDITIDTGISVETLPYVMIMALALLGAALLVVRRRREQF